MRELKTFDSMICVTRLPLEWLMVGRMLLPLAEIFGWSDVRMALRYTHATAESKRRAVENLVQILAS